VRESQRIPGFAVLLDDLVLTKLEQGETESNQDEPSPQKTDESD